MDRPQRTEFDLDELRRREFKLVLCFGRTVATIALAEPGDGVDREFLFALKADARAGGKSKNVFGFNIVPGACVLGARRAATPKNTRDHAEHNGVTPSRLYSGSHLFPIRHFN